MEAQDNNPNTGVEILIVEDSPTQAQRLRHILEQRGYRVTHAANGRLALEAAQRHKPTIIISDVVMPEMDGYELCRRVKADASLGDIPVILVTTLSDPGDVMRGLECRADNFILKPYDEHYLLGRVQFVLLNREVLQTERATMGVEIFFNGQRHFITADRLQILNLLLSTYDAAIQRTKELIRAQEELSGFNRLLSEANLRLEQEIGVREKAEQNLRESEVRLRSIVDNMAAFIGEMSPDGVLTEINHTALRISGLRREDVIAKRLDETSWFSHSPAVQAQIREDIERAQRGETVRHDVSACLADGALLPIDFMLTPVHDAEGRVVKLIPSAVDITERKRAEEAMRESEDRLQEMNKNLERLVTERTGELRESEERFQQLAEHIKEVFWMTDVAKNEMIYISPAYEKIWGRTCESLYASPGTWLDAIHPEDRERIVQTMLTNQPAGTYDEEYRIIRPDGKIRWIHDRAYPVRNQAGEVYRLAGVATDITERQQIERQLHRSQRLESIGTLAGGIAHDLNNALAPIMMGVELLKMEIPGSSDLVDMIGKSARHGADMVRQLLSFAKGAEGERVLVQPKHLITEMQSIMTNTFPKNIRLEFKIEKDLSTVLGDPTQMHQVLLNLCVNARDAMPNGGTLFVEAQTVEVDAVYASSTPGAKPGRYVALRVRDTGTGIPPEILDRIFDPFFTTKGPDKGTGLGLSTAMGIVKGHGGFLKVYSQSGEGTMFTVYFPVSGEASDTAFVKKAEIEFRGDLETILLVDDEAAVREVGRAVLRRLNFTPFTATDGVDGLIQASEHRTKLRAVITDLHMPDMDGVAFIRALRRILPDIPVVLASGQAEERILEEVRTLGVTAHLNKPFTEGQLAAVLQSALAGIKTD